MDLGAMAHAPHDSHVSAEAPAEVLAIEADYNKLIARLRQSERERALLLAGVSHDLRTPLTRVRLAAEMLPVTPETQADLAIITRNVEHASLLIGSFLDFVRAGSLPMDETVDVAAVARSVILRFEREPSELRLELPGEDCLLLHRANGLLIDRLTFNLIDNALKHGRAPVSVSLGRDGRSLILDVCVTGVPACPMQVPRPCSRPLRVATSAAACPAAVSGCRWCSRWSSAWAARCSSCETPRATARASRCPDVGAAVAGRPAPVRYFVTRCATRFGAAAAPRPTQSARG